MKTPRRRPPLPGPIDPAVLPYIKALEKRLNSTNRRLSELQRHTQQKLHQLDHVGSANYRELRDQVRRLAPDKA